MKPGTLTAVGTATLLSVLALSTCVLTQSHGPLGPDIVAEVDTTFHWFGPNDKMVVEAFDDIDAPGVTCYLSRIRVGGFWSFIGWTEDPSESSLVCRAVGKGGVRGTPSLGEQNGREVFSKHTSIWFKNMQVRRFVDNKRQVLIYTVTSDSIFWGSDNHSTSVVPMASEVEQKG